MEKKRSILGFDILKVIAATLILFHHYQQVFKIKFSGINFYDGAFNFGYLVELFFVISGFLTLYSAKAGGLSGLKHKLLRIFPMATLACVFTLLVKSVKATDLAALWNLKTLVSNFFLVFSGWPYFDMLGINNPTWYLCILIQCYILFYLIVWLSEKLKARRVILSAVVVCVAFVLNRVGLLSTSSFRGLEAFFIGVLLCDVSNQIPRMKWGALLLLLVSAILLIIFPSQQRRILTLIIFPILVQLSVWWNGVNNERFRRAISELSMISFEVYIWHYPLMALEQMFIRVFGFEIERTYLTLIEFAVIVWLFAWVLYRFVEKPINKMIRKTSHE